MIPSCQLQAALPDHPQDDKSSIVAVRHDRSRLHSCVADSLPKNTEGPLSESNRTHQVLYVPFLLVMINLGLTISLWLRPTQQPVSPAAQKIAPLPDYLDDDALAELAGRLQELYNAEDHVAMYAEFDELARVQFMADDLKLQLANFGKVVGKIDDTAFSHHEATDYRGRDAFNLHYKVRLSEGPFSLGTLRLSVIDRDDHAGLMGFFVNGTSQGN